MNTGLLRDIQAGPPPKATEEELRQWCLEKMGVMEAEVTKCGCGPCTRFLPFITRARLAAEANDLQKFGVNLIGLNQAISAEGRRN